MCDTAKVLVTGGASFIGSHIVDRLVNEGHDVRVIDNLSTGKLENIADHFRSGKVDFVNGDIRDTELVRKYVQGVEAVIHLSLALPEHFASVQNFGRLSVYLC